MELLIELTKLAAVGIFSGVFSAFIALRRYRHEKWWEMRVNAYRDGIEALSDLVALYENRLRNWERVPTEPDAVRKEITTSHQKIRKLRDMGAFIFSKEAQTALSDFVDFEIQDQSITDPSDIYGLLCRKAEKCLNDLVTVSKNDLGISGKWL